MKRILVFLLLLGFLLPARIVKAQDPVPAQIVDSTVPISTELRSMLTAYLQVSPPAPVSYYAVTYVQQSGFDTLVSLAGLNISAPEETWALEADEGVDGKVVWIGTVRIFENGGGELFSKTPSPATRELASLTFTPALTVQPAAGGGSYLSMPFQAGRQMMYGIRAIHGLGDYGTSGMYAVDLVGGTSMGSGVAGPIVYAADGGTVDYVCNDDTTVAIRTHNGTTGDYFVYAHMLDNANLLIDHVFGHGGAIGTLKSGKFTDTCGWADQANSVYHLHFMFKPSNGSMKIAGYTLTFSDKKFHTADKAIGTGGWLAGGGGGGGGLDDPSAIHGSSGGFNFWDQFLLGIVTFVTGTSNLMPEHNSPTVFLHSVFNTIVLVMKLAWILLRNNINLGLTTFLLLSAFAVNGFTWIIYAIFWVIRVVRLIKQTIAF